MQSSSSLLCRRPRISFRAAAARARASRADGNSLRILGLDDDDDTSLASVKKAFKKKIKLIHPDVNKDPSSTASAEALIKAYNDVVSSLKEEEGEEGEGEGEGETLQQPRNPFLDPRSEALYVFVNDAYCRGKAGCPAWCCCVRTCPEAFEFDEDTGRATTTTRGMVDSQVLDSHQLWEAVGQCPTETLHFVTKDQLDWLLELQEQAKLDLHF